MVVITLGLQVAFLVVFTLFKVKKDHFITYTTSVLNTTISISFVHVEHVLLHKYYHVEHDSAGDLSTIQKLEFLLAIQKITGIN